MPRPPILPALDWASIFTFGQKFVDWLDAAESEQKAAAMQEGLASVRLEPQEEALLQNLARPVNVVAFAEDWCGDVVRHVPVLQALADASDWLQVRYVARAQQPDAFARFLTNGGEAIPKFVFLSDGFVECGHWGPMPDRCRKLIARGKACGDVPAARKKVSALYAADPDRREVIGELLDLTATAAAVAP
jgi:hypothetical protein